MIEAMRTIMSSDLYPLFLEFINHFNFVKMKDYFKYHKGLRVKTTGEIAGPVIE
jgi:hypothetical protein